MNSLAKMLNHCISFLNGTYSMTMALIFLNAFLLLGFYYPENVNLYICFPFSLFTLIAFYKYRGKLKMPVISNKNFTAWVIGITLCAELFYVLAELYYPLRYANDHLIVKESAMYLGMYSILPAENDYYFHMFPNNLNITILFGCIYRVFGTWKAVEIIGSLLVNLSILITGLTVKNLTKSNMAAIIALLLGHFYIGLCFHSFVPYTHNFGILFPILCLYLYTCDIPQYMKLILVILVAAIGDEIKVTTLIPFIAIACYEIISFLRKPQINLFVVAMVSVLICYGGGKTIRTQVYDNIGYQYDETVATTMPFFLMMGQCTETIGQSDGSSYELNKQMVGHSKQERDSLFTAVALQRFVDRGWLGNLKFFGNKICMSWGDGTMSGYKTKYNNPKMQKLSFIYSFPRQYVLYVMLILMLLAYKVVSDFRIYPFLLSITGVFAYQILFESQSRYIYMYTPIMVVISVVTILYLVKYVRFKSVYSRRRA